MRLNHRQLSFGRSFAWGLALPLAICLSTASSFSAPEPETTVPGDLTLGGRFSDQEFEGFGDVILPLLRTGDGLLFFNPRFSGNDNQEEEMNLGVGYRNLLASERLILGVNAYYDTRWTHANNRFDQLGLGLELLSQWVDARFNAYIADDDEKLVDSYSEESVSTSVWWDDPWANGNSIWQTQHTLTTRTLTVYDQYEAAMSGYDAEVGVKLPFVDRFAETRVFVGYQSYDNPFGKVFDGLKLRLEARVLPALILDAEWFDDKDLNGTDYTIGARLSLPFDLGNLARGRNPFAGAADRFVPSPARPLSARLGEMVIRDMKVKGNVSEWITNVEQSSSTEKTTRTPVAVVPDITFVDGDNTNGVEDGTFEHPYNTIQEGVDNARSPVFVWDSTNPYDEIVFLRDGVQLWGNGSPIRVRGGKTFGTGIYPIIIPSGFLEPTIRATLNREGLSEGEYEGMPPVAVIMGDLGEIEGPGPQISKSLAEEAPVNLGIGNELSGFMIVNPSGYGVAAIGVNGTYRIENNLIGAMGGALVILSQGTDTAHITISGNHIIGVFDYGIYVESHEDSQLTTIISGNQIESGFGGILIRGYESSRNSVTIAGNDIYSGSMLVDEATRATYPEPAMYGAVQFEANDGSTLRGLITGNTIYNEEGDGIVGSLIGSFTILEETPQRSLGLQIYDNVIEANGAGIWALAGIEGTLGLDARGNTIRADKDLDILLTRLEPATLGVSDLGNLSANNFEASVTIDEDPVDDGWPF